MTGDNTRIELAEDVAKYIEGMKIEDIGAFVNEAVRRVVNESEKGETTTRDIFNEWWDNEKAIADLVDRRKALENAWEDQAGKIEGSILEESGKIEGRREEEKKNAPSDMDKKIREYFGNSDFLGKALVGKPYSEDEIKKEMRKAYAELKPEDLAAVPKLADIRQFLEQHTKKKEIEKDEDDEE